MSCIDWKSIKAEYIAGGTSYRKLSEKYGVGYQAICRKSQAEGWISLREQHENATVTKTLDKISEKQSNIGSKIVDVADKLLAKLSATIDMMDSIDSQSMKHYTSALKDLKDIKGFKSDADMREQEARINKLIRDAEANNDTSDKEIAVVIEGGDSSWRK